MKSNCKMSHESRATNSDLLLISMESAENRDHNSAANEFDISNNEMVLTTSSLVSEENYTLPPLRGSSSSNEYLQKDGFIHDIEDNVSLSMQNLNSRYKINRPTVNFQKVPLSDESSSSSYVLKSLNNDIQDLSFSVDLRTLHRDDQGSPTYNYYPRNIPPQTDIYGSNFSNEFSSSNFANIPGPSNMFQNDETSTNYLSENQPDELLLNGIELNENDKLILSNEELAMLTQGKPGSCLELILNNGDVIYAVIDSENDYSPSSPRLLQISKEILPPRTAEIETSLVNVNDISSNSRYTTSLDSSFSKTPPISEFPNANSDQNYHSVAALGKSIEPSPINSENFNLCCNFSSNDSTNFAEVMDYSSIVNDKQNVSYEQSILRKSDLSYSCPSGKEVTTSSDSKISNSDPILSKLDYFPNAVNSIVVSETGKKYPKKYSFYSNNFSSFLNQEDCRTKISSQSSVQNSEPVKVHEEKSNESIVPDLFPASEDVKVVENESVKRNSVINVSENKSLSNEEKSIKSKILNSRADSALNSICDQAVQSRARATLPSAYLSINRIKSEGKKSVYGVFAKKTIPSRTQFGPVEGVLIKEEENMNECSNETLQLTIESEQGKFFKLDVSNEEMSNWMRYVRPAASFKEQNLILSQHGSSLYFTTIEVIHPKQELLVWYSVWYSQTRNYSLLSGDPCSDGSYKNIEEFEGTLEVDVDKPTSLDDKNESDVILESVDENIRKNDEIDVRFGAELDGLEVIQKNSKVKGGQSKKQDKLNKSLWLCTYCDLTFSNASVMNLHILIHAVDNVESNETRSEQVVVCENENDKNSCPQCNQEFSQKKELISHVSKHGLKVQRWKDKHVEENIDGEKNENKTVDKFEDKTYECLPCKKKFKNPIALSVHKRFHSDDSVLECPICEVTFHKLAAMREHVHNHALNGVYTCPHCSKKYDRYKHIRKHIRACHCKNTFSCKLCKKTFKSQYKLKSHMLKHSDEREFLCANCGKQFKRKDKLTEHMKNMHSEERERKSLEIMNGAAKKGKSIGKKSLKKKLPTKVLRLITENVNDYFYKCYICNIGFKRRGMLVNHLNSFHPGVSLDTVPELNVPILKAYCNFYCLYCDKVYKSNSKRKAHIIKSHPGAKIPGNLERGTVLNDPYSKHVGSVVSNPFNCEFCYRQYASRAKLLNHHRKNHADLLPADMKSPRSWNSHKKKKKSEIKVDDNVVTNNISTLSTHTNLNNVQIQNVEFDIENNTELTVNVNSQDVITLQNSTKDGGDVNQQIMSLTHLLNEELRNSTTQEQYLKILQSSNGMTIAQTDENGEHPVSLENSSLLHQILTSYSFSNS